MGWRRGTPARLPRTTRPGKGRRSRLASALARPWRAGRSPALRGRAGDSSPTPWPGDWRDRDLLRCGCLGSLEPGIDLCSAGQVTSSSPSGWSMQQRGMGWLWWLRRTAGQARGGTAQPLPAAETGQPCTAPCQLAKGSQQGPCFKAEALDARPQKGSSLSGMGLTTTGLRSCRSNSRSAQSRSSRSRGTGRWAAASSQSSSRVRELRDWKKRRRDAVATAGAAKTPKQAGRGQGAVHR